MCLTQTGHFPYYLPMRWQSLGFSSALNTWKPETFANMSREPFRESLQHVTPLISGLAVQGLLVLALLFQARCGSYAFRLLVLRLTHQFALVAVTRRSYQHRRRVGEVFGSTSAFLLSNPSNPRGPMAETWSGSVKMVGKGNMFCLSEFGSRTSSTFGRCRGGPASS